MATIYASCLFCKSEFPIEPRCIRLKNLHHHCILADRDYKSAKMKAWNRKKNRHVLSSRASASCLYCREVFTLRPDRKQRTHGCKKAQAARRNSYDKTDTKRRIRELHAEEHKATRIKDNLHVCPKCKIVMTANHYACSQCWAKIDSMGDIETIMAWNTGESRRVSRPRASHDWAY